jgi:hypothetical protein
MRLCQCSVQQNPYRQRQQRKCDDVAYDRNLTEKIPDKIKNQLGVLLQKRFILGRQRKTVEQQ